MNTSLSSHNALVLGGGGSLGNAWLIGVIAGLVEAGTDVTDADLIVGTSAGATAAAMVASGTSPAELLASVLDEAPSPRPPFGGPVVDHLERTNQVIAESTDVADLRRRLGASALGLETPPDHSARWRATVVGRLPSPSWPDRRVLITAVNARSGQPVVFDRQSGVELVDAVAASTSGGFAYAIGDELYIDGGYRTNAENADLAGGYERVLVLSPFGGRSRLPESWGMQLAHQVDALRESGSEVESIYPSADSLAVFGVNMMDLSRRPAAARAGYDQGRARGNELGDFWS